MALGEDEQFDFKLPSPCLLKTTRQFVSLLSCQNEAATPTSPPRLAAYARAESFSFHVGGWFKNDGSSLPLVNADEVFHKWKLLSKPSSHPAAATISQSNDRKVNTPARTPSNIPRATSEGRGTREFGIGSTRHGESRHGRLKMKDVIVIRGGSDEQNVQRKFIPQPQYKTFNDKGALSLKKDITATTELKKTTFLPYHTNTMFGCINWDSTLNSIRRGFPLPSRTGASD